MNKTPNMGIAGMLVGFVVLGVTGKAEGEWDVPKDESKFHIFIFAGQSNMAGGFNGSHLYDDEGNYDPLTQPVPRVLQYKRGNWVPAAHPTTRHVKTSFSIPLPFARKYLEEINDPEVKVGIFVTAYGGKAINFFVKGGTMHPRGTAALPEHGTVKGFIWHQGESDNRLEEREAYAQKLHGLVRDVRGYVGDPELPFVTGAFNPQWAYYNPYSIPPGPPADPEAKDMRGAYEAQITTGNVLAHIDVLDKAAHVQSTGASHLKGHKRKLVDENGKLTGQTQGIKTEAYSRKAAVPGQPYRDRVYYHFRKPQSSDLTEPNNETVTFSKVDGPAWLEVHADGTFSGTPAAADAGQTQELTVKAADVDGEDTAVYAIPVLESGFVWHESFKYQPDIPWVAVGDRLSFDKSMPADTWYIRSGHFPFTYTTPYSCYDVAGVLGANAYKFGRGTLRGIAFVLDGRRFGGKAGRVRFSIDLSDVVQPEPTGRAKNIRNRRAKRREELKAGGLIEEGERHFFVSLYQCVLGDAEEDAVEVVLGNDRLRGRNAEVTTRGDTKLTRLVTRDYSPSDQGVQTLKFNYGGKGDILLTLSAVNEKQDAGGKRNFRNLSFQFIE